MIADCGKPQTEIRISGDQQAEYQGIRIQEIQVA
jgi:hypothetical protein